ncbi:unnamed protein product, partial [Closterium sp. Naga37s-1]
PSLSQQLTFVQLLNKTICGFRGVSDSHREGYHHPSDAPGTSTPTWKSLLSNMARVIELVMVAIWLLNVTQTDVVTMVRTVPLGHSSIINSKYMVRQDQSPNVLFYVLYTWINPSSGSHGVFGCGHSDTTPLVDGYFHLTSPSMVASACLVCEGWADEGGNVSRIIHVDGDRGSIEKGIGRWEKSASSNTDSGG